MSLGNVYITPELVQAVRDSINILDIAGGHTNLKRMGQRYKGLCPLHKEKTPSFSVDADKGVFYCFGCGQGGDAIRLHQLLSGDDFPAAMEALANRYGIPLPSRPATGRGSRQERDLGAPLEAALELFRDALEQSPKPLEYLERRRMPRELIERYEVGYALPGWDHLFNALRQKFPVKDLEAAGLVARSERAGGKVYDRFRDRLMFPIRNAAGRLVGFGGRTLGDDKAKYINTAETSRFAKGRILYGLDSAKKSLRESGRVLLVEGYFDVLGAAAAGVDGAVASMGTALTAEQSKLLARFADEVVIGYDGDRAGVEAGVRALPILLAAGLDVLRLELGDGHDPDSLRLEEGPEVLRQRVEEAPDAVLLQLDRLIPPGSASEPRHQARSARQVTELLRPIPDPVLKYGYAKQAAERLAVPAELLLRRAGASGEAPGAGPAGPRTDEVRSVEEKLLQMLLGDAAPPLENLPSPDVFMDPIWRNIFEVFSDLYKSTGGKPEAGEVLEKLPEGGDAVDRAARLLLEEPVNSRSGEFEEALRHLERRWAQRRMRELTAEISEAQRSGDQVRLERLVGEKTSLSRSLHRQTEA